jgi:3-oxoacyl-[acyl-carrier-protein] synthase II
MAWNLMQELRDDPIVVTGRGAVSGCGYGTGPLLAAVRTGQPGGRWVDVAGQRYAACLVETFSGTGNAKRLDPSVQFALAAADEAMREAGLMPPREGSPSSGLPDPDQTGVVVGTSRGCQAQWETALKDLSGNKRPRPTLTATTTLAALSGAVAQQSGACGPGMTVSATCASGAAAICYAAEQLILGHAKVMLAGGADGVQNGLVFPGMAAAGLLGSHPDPARVCRPFESGRNGLLLGEGAGFLVLERASHAAARGALPLGRLAGWALSVHDSAGKTGLSEDGGALAGAIRRALLMAGWRHDPDFGKISYINAHGTGTSLNDRAETAALRTVFGQDIPPLSSTKPVTGHALGATPLLEAIIALAALAGDWLPPQAGWTCDTLLDPALGPLDVPREPGRPLGSGMVLSNSLGFWGYHAALVLARA